MGVELLSDVIYHGNCYDGFGSAYAAWIYLGDKARYTPALYGQEPPDLQPDARVLICDFSYPREKLLRLKDDVAALHVIDHHKTAQADLEGLDFCEFDMEHSGAWLTWRHFFGEPIPEFIQYLEDRDLWRFKLPESRGVSQALRAYPFDFRVWFELFGDVDRLKREAPVIERFTKQMVALICDNATRQTIDGHEVPVANATVFFSEVGEELCKRNPGDPFAAYYLDRADGLRQWGLRSRGGFDVSVVAKNMGGGGHAAAAGWTEDP